MKSYEAPKIEIIGSLHELTLGLNKVGSTDDIYSTIVPIIGSIVPSP
jgi:hypothetical protein